MHERLEAMKTAMQAELHDDARAIAKQYVKDNPAKFADFESLTLEGSVRAVDVFREAGMVERQYEGEAWLMYRFAPQSIGGAPPEVIINPPPSEEA